jgi:head-tail adaptor
VGKSISLNWPLRLEERQRTADGAGGFSETWVELGLLWGEVQARSASATEVTAGSTSLVRYRIYVRGAAEGDPKRPKVGQRFWNGAKVYVIDSVSENDPHGSYLTCWAREEVLA